MKKFYFLLLLLLSLSALNAQHSWKQPGLKFNGAVNSILPDVDDKYFVGGSFTLIGDDSINGIARWEGEKFINIGLKGITGSSIQAMVKFNGYLVVAGNFNQIDSINCNNIAYWDGTKWNSFGQGLEYTGATTVSTLTVYKGDLYAAGSFQRSGTDSVSNIAKWNGTTWVPLQDGIKGAVKTMCEYNNELYVGGTFPYAGGLAVNNIAKWDGSQWNTAGDGLEYTGATTVSTLQVYNGNLYAGGIFHYSGTTPVEHVAKWDGSSWSDVGGGLDYTGATTVSTLCFTVYGEKLIAEGKYRSTTDSTVYYYVAQSWNDTAWVVKESRTDLPILTLKEVNNDLFAGGEFTIIEEDTISYFAQWKFGTLKKGIILEEGKHFNFNVYPNPSHGELWIKPDNNITFNIELNDMLGRKVFSSGNVNDTYFLDPSMFKPGMYSYRITDDHGNRLQQGKLIIE